MLSCQVCTWKSLRISDNCNLVNVSSGIIGGFFTIKVDDCIKVSNYPRCVTHVTCSYLIRLSLLNICTAGVEMSGTFLLNASSISMAQMGTPIPLHAWSPSLVVILECTTGYVHCTL